ncbi:transposase, partial [Streptomyces avermitilis]|uniref:transposase n=2 Tax=Streptomyces TaxID=1883 RepID=UPI0033B43707
YDHLRRWLRKRGIRHRIARKGIESSKRLGRHRWVVERTVSWLAGCRRLHRRYERKAEHFLAFAGIAAALICHRRLTK